MIETQNTNEEQSSLKNKKLAGALVLCLCILFLVSSIPGQPDGLGVFTDSLIEDLQISRVSLSSALAIGTLCFGFLVPFTGQLMDRVGVHKVLFLAPFALAGMFGLLTRLPPIIETTFPDSPLLHTFLLASCFLVIRLLAQGCMGVGSRVVIAQWFQKRRGLATGLFAALTTLAFNMSPPLLNHLVEGQGWQETYMLISIYLIIIPPICIGIFWGSKASSTVKQINKSSSHTHSTLKVLRSAAFWVFALTLALQAMFMDSIKIHMTDLGATQGLNRSDTYFAFVPMAFVALATNLIGGWLSDKLRLAYIASIMLSAQILACVGLITMQTIWGQGLFALGYGIAIGLFGILNVITWPRLFGPQNLGHIVGLSMSVIILATAVGPVLFGLVKAHAGTYRPLLYCWPIPVVIMILASWRIKETPED